MVTELSQSFEPSLIARVPDLEAIIGARRLARCEGVLAGASSGAVVAALLERAAELPSGSTVAMVLHDGGQPYLDTIYNDAWVTERFDISAADLARGVDDWGSE